MKSISNKQLSANRRNALKSTGPKTVEGRSIVARNTTKHGLLARHVVIEGESQSEFSEFRQEMLAEFAPVGILEQNLADKVIASLWRLKRTDRIEVEILESISERESSPSKRDLPFRVIIRKTYAGSPDEIEEKSLPTDDPEPAPTPAEEPKKITLGRAVRTDLEGANILIKLHRYEAHIDHVMYRALHELQRLQAKRMNQQIDAPHVIDVDITGDPANR